MGELDFWDLSELSDEQLLRGLNGFLADGARVEARVVAHLAEVEERRLHLKAACSSLFDYCLRRLGLSESEAFHRITAARLARRFPVIFELLAARSVHLSALRVLRDHLTHDNHRLLLAAASGKSKKEVEILVATLAPRPDVAPLLRKLPAIRQATPSPSPIILAPADRLRPYSGHVLPVFSGRQATGDATELPSSADPLAADATELRSGSQPPAQNVTPGSEASLGCCQPSWSLPPRSSQAEDEREPTLRTEANDPSAPCPNRRNGSAAPRRQGSMRPRELEPLSSTRYSLRLSVSRKFKEKLERARELMSHAEPSGELASVMEKALDSLLAKLEKQRFAQTKRPRSARKLAREAPSARHTETSEGESQERAAADPPVIPRPREGSPQTGAAQRRDRARREHIPNEIRRAVAARDDFQCTYVDGAGRRCPSRAFLQLHHERAHARGGPSTLENLRMLCGSHNRLLAEQDFGRAHQERVTGRGTATPIDPALLGRRP